jgi:16S rRNA pseudouridine516 synthase
MSAARETLRLDRLLSNMGYGTRKDIQALVKAGRVVLDGRPITDPGAHMPVLPSLCERLIVSGQKLDPPPGLVLLLHKPLGVTCSHKETGALVYSLLPLRWQTRKPTISTIGRLDKETSGLLLMTDDGGLLHRVIAPKSHIAKRYVVTLARPLRGDEVDVLASGTLLLDGDDKPLLRIAMELVSSAASDQPVVTVTLHEGRYHQVRRMFAAMGNHVVQLHRDRVGGLTLPADLAPGSFRILDVDSIAAIFA